MSAGLLSLEEAEMSVKVIEGERGKETLINEPGEAGAEAPTDGRGKISERLTREEMQEELDKRVEMMRTGNGGDGVPDQYRVYQFIISELEKGSKFLRLMVQASAGTGKFNTQSHAAIYWIR